MSGLTDPESDGGPLRRPLRLALVHPTYWPEVRRGSERLVHDLAVALGSRGHDVTLLTSHRGRPRTTVEDGVRVVRSWRPPEGRAMRKYELFAANAPNVLWHLVRGGFDLAHAFFTSDAWAAAKASRLGGPPAIFSFHGVPIRSFLVERRYRIEMMQEAAADAAATTVLSHAAAERFSRFLVHDPIVLPGGVMCSQFAVDEPPAAEPTLLCAASIGAPHKRAEVLFAGFEELRRRRPDARLLLVRTPDPHMSKQGPELPEGAEWIDADQTAELARAYSRAWASVLSSVDEAFGLVLLESLAAGTPVVAARSGGTPEIVSDERVGRLFEPDDPEDLARAMEEALDLGGRPETPSACQAHAARWDWSRVVLRYEAVYDSVLDGGIAR